MNKIFFITNTLPRIHGGRTKSLFQRARLLNSRGIDLTIVCTNYNSEHSEIFDYFKSSDKVLENTKFLNIYEYYRKKCTFSREKRDWETTLYNKVGSLSDYDKVLRSKNGKIQYYYRDGRPCFAIKKNDQNIPEYFALYRDWNFKPYQYYFINNEGTVDRINTYNQKSELQFQEFLTNDGYPYINMEYHNGKKSKINLNQESSSKEFLDEKTFISYFFNEIFDETDIVINDARFLDIPLLKVNVLKRIFQMHNTHLQIPTDSSSDIKGSFSHILNSKFPKTDVIVSLTDKQKEDILSKVPSLNQNIQVIPHSIKMRDEKYPKLSNHFGLVCRLHPQKNLKDAIKAFQLFQLEYPNYILDIYGDGECREELIDFVSELKIKDKVVFHGNVEQIDMAFQSIHALLITSNFEGFGLNALESIANGTQVITYEVNYGPADIIDEQSGWVTKDRTPLSLKERMIESVLQPKDSMAVKKRSLKFSEENFVSKWLKVIDRG